MAESRWTGDGEDEVVGGARPGHARRAGSPEMDLLQRAWEGMRQGDFSIFEDALAEDARWRTVDEGPSNCEGRSTIIEVLIRSLDGRLRGEVDEAIQMGERVIVAFRPEQRSGAPNRPLDDGVAYTVVTVRDGSIIELKGCADRTAAHTYARTGELPDGPGRAGVRAPEDVAGPSGQRVDRLVPFVKVADVERSIAFYHHLGFTVKSVFTPRDRLAWAALESNGAEVMFERSSDPIDADRQGVLFYLYSQDLPGLREQLLDAGIAAGEIEDGSPGPRRELSVTDPDGYVLMVAQIEE